jgi:hypothetical protein
LELLQLVLELVALELALELAIEVKCVSNRSEVR